MKIFIDPEVKELERQLREEAVALADEVNMMDEDDERWEKANANLDKALKRWHEVYAVVEERNNQFFEKAADVGASVIKIGASLGANVILAIVVGRMEFVDGRLIPTWGRVNIPIGGPKL